jgi:hypothetical protein
VHRSLIDLGCPPAPRPMPFTGQNLLFLASPQPRREVHCPVDVSLKSTWDILARLGNAREVCCGLQPFFWLVPRKALPNQRNGQKGQVSDNAVTTKPLARRTLHVVDGCGLGRKTGSVWSQGGPVTKLRMRVLEELERRNYSKATARASVGAIGRFAAYFHCSPDELSAAFVFH